jgi:hypothetical protein
LQAAQTLQAMNEELERGVAQRSRALSSAAPDAASAAERSGALEEILRLTKWLEDSSEAQVDSMRRACAASIATAARALAQA